MQMLAHGLVAGALFLLIGLLYERTHTRDVNDYSSLMQVTPRFAFFTSLALLAGMGLGFTLALFVLGSVRELFGSGSVLGVSLFGAAYPPFLLLILPPGAFITLGLLLAAMNRLEARR